MKFTSFMVIVIVASLIFGSVLILLRSAALDKYANWRIASQFWVEYHLSDLSTAPAAPQIATSLATSETFTKVTPVPVPLAAVLAKESVAPIGSAAIKTSEQQSTATQEDPDLNQKLQVIEAAAIRLQMEISSSQSPEPSPIFSPGYGSSGGAGSSGQ